MEKISVIVTGIGAGSHGEQVLKALKLSKELNLCLIGTNMTEITTGKNQVDFFYKIPPVSNNEYISVIFDIIEKHNVRFIFPGCEPELKFFSENREIFEQRGIGLPLNSKEIINLCMNKYEMFKKLEDLDIPVPRYKKINTSDDINDIDFFPVVLKPNTSSGGSVYLSIAMDNDELYQLTKYYLKIGIDLLAQEYIDAPDDEYTIGVSSDKNGNIWGSIAIRRILDNTLTTRIKMVKNGKIIKISTGISQGEIIKNLQILSQAEHIAKAIGSKGPLNIQCRFFEGNLYPFEINPRFSGTTSLRAMVGYNEPEAMIKYYVLGMPVKLTDYRETIILRTIVEEELEK